MAISTLVQQLTGQTPPAGLLAAWESMLSAADACLANYSTEQQELVKAYAIAHLLAQQNGGEIETDRSPTGASVTYQRWRGQGTGLESTRFGAILRSLPGGECVASVINKPKRFARSINPSAKRHY